ncbi:MAG: DUF6349 family protein [Nocardioides sp.]|uniref:DUF6349 family protein n=1 Tax=Nocardioides sp. TaxID=35761 RepID=UPI0039E500D9
MSRRGQAATEVDFQFAFDIEGMIREAEIEAAPPWTGAPLHFTIGYYAPGELDAAFAHWQFLNSGVLGAYSRSHMWHRAVAVPGGVQVGDHGFDMFNADLRCLADSHRHGNCECMGDHLYQSVCEPCEWHTVVTGENEAVEAWHDHAIPDWRDLPIVPVHIKVVDSSMRPTKQARDWIEEHYPEHMRFPGAPIITERPTMGHRHVPGRSPWAGYDLSHTAVDPDRVVPAAKPTARARRARPSPEARRTPTPSSGLGIGD